MMVATDPRARLLELAAARALSLSELSRLIGRNTTYLQQFIRKGSPRRLEETDRRTLARFFGVDEAELGAPEDFSSASRSVGGRAVRGSAGGGRAGRDKWVEVPRLALGASAGPGTLALDEQAVGAFRFSAQWVRQQGLDPAMLSAIVVSGDSMEPVLRDGDEILVDRTPRALRDGIHVVRVGDVLLVKRLDIGVPGRIVLSSENQAYRPIELAPDEVAVIGRVVWKGGRL